MSQSEAFLAACEFIAYCCLVVGVVMLAAILGHMLFNR